MIKTIFENENFIVCDKPSQWLSVPDRFESGRPCLGLELQKQLNQQIFPVHRLDYEVSGLIIYAKNQKAHKVSQAWFLDKKIQKKYLGITSIKQDFSHWPKDKPYPAQVIEANDQQSFFWAMKILRGKKRSYESQHGDLSETEAVIQKKESNQWLYWDLYPITGKPHQLRLELSRHGFPLLGDELYGSKIQVDKVGWTNGGIALRAIQIQLNESITNRLGLPSKIAL